MPSTMVHLMTAYEYNPDSSAEFWVGNIAPDCIDDRKERNKFHFKDIPDRVQALNEFAKSINKDDWFSEGILLHLFVDWKWDEDLRDEDLGRQYISKFNSNDWFQSYRNEMGLVSARLYHDCIWSIRVWEEMLSCDISKQIKTHGIILENILSTLQRVNKYHIENSSAEPLFYPIESIKEFATKTAKDYQHWRNTAAFS